MIADLSGLRAVVTGAGTPGGMGGTIAEVLAAQGAIVAVTDVRLEGAEDVASSLGDDALAVELDVGDDTSTARAFALILERWGTLTFWSTMRVSSVTPAFRHGAPPSRSTCSGPFAAPRR